MSPATPATPASPDAQAGVTEGGRRFASITFPVARMAMVARWKPVHLGHAAVLRGLSDAASEVLIGIGSSNKYDARNPFTAAETAEMIRRLLAGRTNYQLIEVPDLGNGPRWRLMVRDLMGPLDAFVTANDYVHGLMADLYPVIHPASLVAPRDRSRMTGTQVRRSMLAGGEAWQDLLPRCVADYLIEHHLVERFRREFADPASEI